MNDIYLYIHSAEDARERDELPLWRASYRANIACKSAIEEAVRKHFDGSRLDGNCLNGVLEEYGYRRTAWVLANTLQQLEWDGRFSLRNKAWAKEFLIPPDKRHNLDFAVTSHPAVLDGVVDQYRKAYQALGLFGPDQCEPNSWSELDYEGKVLVLSLGTLKESCWSPQNQLWLAHDGFGCSPTAIGRSIRCTCLGDGEETRWNRADFLGVLKPEHLPDWARGKLEELRMSSSVLSRAELEQSLSGKIEAEWMAFAEEILALPPKEIMEQAEVIAATRLCRNEMTENIRWYSTDLLEFLNTLPEPLIDLRNRWMDEQEVDPKEEMTHAIWELQERLQREQRMEPDTLDGMTMT